MSAIFTSKFVKIIKTLSEDELKSFEIWLKSPWCNSNKNLVRLLEKLRKYYPAFEGKKLSKEKLFQQVLPHGKFSDRRMNNLLSEGYLAAEQFLIFHRVAKDENLQKDLLSRELQSRYLDDWFFKRTTKEILQLEKKAIKDWEDHLYLLQLHRRIYHHPNQHPRMQPGGLTIVKMGQELDLLYLLEKAAIINEKIFRTRILKNENHEVERELENWQLAAQGIDHPAIEFYKMRFAYTENNLLEQYQQLRTAFLQKFEQLNEKEQKVHLLSLLNDTSKLTRAKAFSITAFLPLYKLGLKTEILLHQGMLTYTTFSTIVSASNLARDFSFTSYFIEKYTPKLAEPYQKDALNWAKAHTANRKNKLTDSLDILLKHDFKTFHFQLMSKLLASQTYFDLYIKDDSYQEYLFNYFDAFEKWLMREKLGSQITKEGFLRFVQKCRSLTKLYADINFYPEKLNQLFENEKNIQALSWLKEKKELVIQLRNEH